MTSTQHTDKRPARRPRFDELRKVAYHEAGHAVSAYLAGMPFQVVSIVPDEVEGSMGRVIGLWHIVQADANSLPDAKCGQCGRGLDVFQLVSAVVKNHEYRGKRDVALIAIRSLFAGQEAERILTGRLNVQGARSDNQSIEQLAENELGCYSDASRRAMLRALRLDARDELTQSWYLVEGLANALLERHELSESEAIDVITAASQRHLGQLTTE